MNLLEVPVADNALAFGQSHVPVPPDVARQADGGGRRVTLGIRPEDWSLSALARASVRRSTWWRNWADAYIYSTADVNGEQHEIMARVDGRNPPAMGSSVNLAPKSGHLHMFSVETGQRLGD